jgi:hypothetical protein
VNHVFFLVLIKRLEKHSKNFCVNFAKKLCFFVLFLGCGNFHAIFHQPVFFLQKSDNP